VSAWATGTTVIAPADEQRVMPVIRDVIATKYNDDAFQRVIYSESHDEVANGKARVPYEIDQDDSKGWQAQKRSTLAAALVFRIRRVASRTPVQVSPLPVPSCLDDSRSPGLPPPS